jgi:hypothetical protein
LTLFQAAKSDIDPGPFVECLGPCRRYCRSSQRSSPWYCRPKRRRRLRTSSLPFWTMRDAPSAKLPLPVSVTRCVLRVSLLLDPQMEACPKLRCNSLSSLGQFLQHTHILQAPYITTASKVGATSRALSEASYSSGPQ